LTVSQPNRRVSAVRDKLLEEAEINSVQNADLVQKRREQICDAALELFLEKGFASTTIRDICARSGINQASIYDYIANKNDIMRRLMNQVWFRRDVPSLPEILEDQSLSLEEALIRYFQATWTAKRKGTLLVYRSVPYMLEEDRKAMHAREIANMKDVADELRRRTDKEITDGQLEILANFLVFQASFGPMRDWLNKGIPQERFIRVIAAGVAAMVRELIETPIPDDTPSQPQS